MSMELTNEWSRIGTEILSTARNELYLNMRFLDLALSSFRFQLNTEMRIAGTDGYVMYYEPYALADLYERDRKYLNRLYLHMVFHCMFRHLTKRGDREKEDWNLACDIANESILDSLSKRSVKRPVTPERTEIYKELKRTLRVLTAEGIYRILTEGSIPPEKKEELSEIFQVDDHRLWPEPEQENKQPNRSNHNELDRHWEEISEKTQTRMETMRSETSEENGDLSEQMRVENRTRQDYRAFLRKFAVIREEIQVDTDSFDYGFYSYGLRLYGNMPLIEPQEFKEVQKIQDFVIALDTSMSTSGDLVRSFLSETYGILTESESFFKKINLHVIQCDDKVETDVKITNRQELEDYMENLQLLGGGGTDFRPVFTYVEELRERGEFHHLKGLIYFTDGYGIFPKKRPDYDTAFLFMKEDYNDEQVPPWAIRLILEPEDLEPERALHTELSFVERDRQ